MEIGITVSKEEQPILDAFKGELFKKKVEPSEEGRVFIRAFYEFFKSGWLARHARVDISINRYHEKFKDKLQ